MGSNVSTASNNISSNYTGEDRISELPLPIIHDILSFLPVKEAARTIVLSKRWRSIWNSSPALILDEKYFFSLADIFNNKRALDNRNKFVEFVNGTLSRRDSHWPIQKLYLHMTGFDADLKPQVEEWLDIALENRVKVLDISIRTALNGKEIYRLMQKAFLSQSVTSMKLAGLELNPLPGSVNLSSLRTLSLNGVHLYSQALQSIFSGCPVIQSFSLKRCRLKNVQISSDKVKHITLKICYGLKKVQIEGLNLHSFTYIGSQYDLYIKKTVCKIDVAKCKNLVNLTLKTVKITDRFLEHRLPKFDKLENLIIDGCRDLVNAKISQKSLRTLEFSNCELSEVNLDVPNLVQFKYSGPLIALSSWNVLELLEADISVDLNLQDISQFGAFCDFLNKFDHCKGLTLNCHRDKELIFPEETRKFVVSPLSHLEHLTVKIMMKPGNYGAFLDSLCWICPNLDTLHVNIKTENLWLKHQIGKANERLRSGESADISMISDITERFITLKKLKTKISSKGDGVISDITEKLNAMKSCRLKFGEKMMVKSAIYKEDSEI